MSYSKTGRSQTQGLIYRKSESIVLEPDPPFWTKTSWLQLGYGVWVNLTLMNIGLSMEFAAVAIPQLKEEADISISQKQEATIASILTLASPIGCIIAGVLLDSYGRKAGLIWCHVPLAIGWFYIAWAKYASDIILGRVIKGIGMGMAMAAPRAYVTEITLPNMRGVIGALPPLSISLGLTIQAILGAFLNWRFLCIICGVYAVILLIANKFLPDTPYYILMKYTASAAKVTLKRFRSSRFNVEAELQTLQEFKDVNHIHRLTLCETRKAMGKSYVCKPFGIIFFYVLIQQFAGNNVVTTWAVDILKVARSSIDVHLGNVILAMTRVVFGVLTSFLLFKVARRSLAMVSAVGVGLVGIVLGGLLITAEGGRSPLVLLVAFVGFAVPGYHTLPMLMMFELFPLQVRGILSGVILSTANLLMSLVIYLYPIMRDNMGLGYTFILYGAISLFGAIVLYFILPETKDLTLQEIEEYYNHRRSTLISERKLLSDILRSRSTVTRSQILTRRDRQASKEKTKKARIVLAQADDTPRDTSSGAGPASRRASVLSYDDIVIVYYDSDEDDGKKENALDIEKKEKKIKIEENKSEIRQLNDTKRDETGQDTSETSNVAGIEKVKADPEKMERRKQSNMKKEKNMKGQTEQNESERKEGGSKEKHKKVRTEEDEIEKRNKDKKERKEDKDDTDDTDKPSTSKN